MDLAKLPKLAVISPSFSSHPKLLEELEEVWPNFQANLKKKVLGGKDLVHFIGDAEVIILGREVLDKIILDALPTLRFVSKYGVGLDNMDLDYLKKRDIDLGVSVGVNAHSVAELVLGFFLGLSRNIFLSHENMRKGLWVKKGGSELREKTVGIIGCGHTGSALIKLLLPFQCEILIHDILDKTEFIEKQKKIGQNCRASKKEEIYEKADFISLHVPLTKDTFEMIQESTFSKMKRSAFLVNTSRGAVIDEKALKKALEEKRIAGAAIDVFVEEPFSDLDFLSLENFFCTPHIGGNSQEAILSMGRGAIQKIREYRQAVF